MKQKRSSRRQFIAKAGSGLIGAGIVSSQVLAQESVKEERVQDLEKGLAFLFQGDSITDGNRGRTSDPNHIMGHGYAYSIASRVGADFPRAGFTFCNRGISGNRVTDLENRWEEDTLKLKPDVLSLLIGINDAAAVIEQHPKAQKLSQFEATYRRLLQMCQEVSPNVLMVLGLPFVFPVGPRQNMWEQWKGETKARADVVRVLAQEFNAVVVDYVRIFEDLDPIDYWIWDGIHPTVFGHELMAREWLKQVSSRLKFLKIYR